MHLGMEECPVPFSGHCDLDLLPSSQLREPADLGLTGLFFGKFGIINTDKQVTFGDNTETPPTVERLTDHVTFMPRLKHRFIGSSYFIFTPKLFYSCLKKRN